MKKAKIFLTALTVLAVVGGTVAFKAKKTRQWFATCDLNSNPKVCTAASFSAFLTTTNVGPTVDYDAYGKPCILDPIEGYTCTTKTTIFD